MNNEAGVYPLVARDEACTAITAAATAAREGQGSTLLVTGEAGMGKTAVVTRALARCDLLPLTAPAYEGHAFPYGPLIEVLRAYGRQRPSHPSTEAPLARALALLVPERSMPPLDTSSGAPLEAVRVALVAIARRQPVAIFLDDIQWADHATLELLPDLSSSLTCESLLIIGAFRGDEIARDHPLRRVRSALRRAGRLHEISLAPLNQGQTAQMIGQVLGAPPSADLAMRIYDRTEGLPFFVEELAIAVLRAARLSPCRAGLDLDPNAELEVSLPETVRDAVLLRTRGLSVAGRRALEIASVAGLGCDIDLVTTLSGSEDGMAELLAHRLIVERGPGRGAFHHALVRDACYADVSWLRRRTLHRQVAAYLEDSSAPAALVAEHWLAAHEPERARPALLAAAESSCQVHAYRDAARTYQRALEVWPEEAEANATGRLDALERLGHCAELIGDLVLATSTWRDAADAWRQAHDPRRLAMAERRLAGIHELQGNWEHAMEARDAAASAFAASSDSGNAATERLLAATHLRSAANYHAALALLDAAHAEAMHAGRLDLQARTLSLEGNVRARLGQIARGLDLVRAGLALALEHDLIGPATEIYQRLADTLEHAGDYTGAQVAYGSAAAFCQTHQAPATAQICHACLTVVLRLTGDWERATTVSRSVLATSDISPHARAVASGVLGSLYVLRGQARPARPLLLEAAALSRHIELAAMEIYSSWGLAMLDDITGSHTAGLARCRALLVRWERTEERHHAVVALRWATTFCADNNGADETRACAAALAHIAAATGQAEALSALAHALGETALLDGDAHGASRQFEQAIALLRDQPLPFERAQSARRAGIAFLLAGERSQGIDRLVTAYRTARTLGARPLAAQIAHDLASQGEPVERRLGRRAGGHLQQGGLSRRELEVLGMIAAGQTSREVGSVLFLSPRTVETHVDHLLAKLDCRTRAEAVRKATALGLIG